VSPLTQYDAIVTMVDYPQIVRPLSIHMITDDLGWSPELISAILKISINKITNTAQCTCHVIRTIGIRQ